MSDFATCFPFVLGNEDFDPPRYDFVLDPTSQDPNACAIAGINSAYWSLDFATIAALPQAERGPAVADFYQRNFWNDWFEQIASNRTAAMILDSSVNQGSRVAVRLAQIAAGCPMAEQDGRWGPITVERINAASDFVTAFVAAREAKYRETGGPSLSAWLARAAKIPEFA